MTIEAYWQNRRKIFLARAKEARDDQELLSQYRMLLEEMKMEALAHFPHEDVLRQQTALLFHQAMQGAELLLAKGFPVVVHEEQQTQQKPVWLPKWLLRPEVNYLVLGAGLVYSLLAGKDIWRSAIFFVAAIALVVVQACFSPKSTSVATAVSSIRVDYLDGMITRQAQMFDQHIADLQLLLQDAVSPVTDLPLEPAALSLCQYVWAFANGNYPAESALYTAEKLLHHNDVAWAEYSPELRGCFDVMPTQKESRTVYPALRKISDNTLVSKGQYIESRK